MCDMPAVFRQAERKARKEHKCCECRQSINPGERYVYSSGIWDGKASDFKQCLICAEVSNAAAASVEDPEDAPGFGILREWFAGYCCREFTGAAFIASFAKDLNLAPEKIEHVLGPNFFR